MLKPWQVMAMRSPDGVEGGQADGGSNPAAVVGSGEAEQSGGAQARPSFADVAGARNGLLSSTSAGSDEGANPDAAAVAPSPNAPAVRPDFIPEKFWDADKGAPRLEQMARSYAEMERAFGQMRSKAEVPADPAAYKADGDQWLGDVLKQADRVQLQDGLNDPGLEKWWEIAHKHNLPVKAARAIAQEMMLASNDMLPEPLNPEAELEKLGKNGKALVGQMQAWVSGLYENGALSRDEVEVMLDLGANAAGVRLMNKLRAMTGEKPMPVATSNDGKSMSADEWHASYDAAMAAKDYGKQAQLDQLRDELWPDGMPMRSLR